MRHKMIRLSVGAIALGCIAFFIIGMIPTDAKCRGFQYRGPCTIVGTWHGGGDGGFTWISVYTPGRNAINGQLTSEWVYIDPTLGMFPDAVRVTNAYGVWKKVGWRMYQYTWRACGLDEFGTLLYTARVSGEMELVDCDNVDSTYVLELWLAGDDIDTDPPFLCVSGTGTEARMPLVQASCE